MTGKVDKLQGLKENVIIGRLIPAGTGYGDQDYIDLTDLDGEKTLEEDPVQASEMDEKVEEKPRRTESRT